MIIMVRKEISPITHEERNDVLGKAFCAASYRLYRDLTWKVSGMVYDFERFRSEFEDSVEQFERYRDIFSDPKLAELAIKEPELTGMGLELKRTLGRKNVVSIAGREMPHPFYLCALVIFKEQKGYEEIGKRLREATEAGKYDIRDVISFLTSYRPSKSQTPVQPSPAQSSFH
jgi:hypothetical protein